MSRPTREADPAPRTYALNEQAHACLVEVRNHLRLLAILTAPDEASSDQDATYHAEALSSFFARLARDVEAVFQATH